MLTSSLEFVIESVKQHGTNVRWPNGQLNCYLRDDCYCFYNSLFNFLYCHFQVHPPLIIQVKKIRVILVQHMLFLEARFLQLLLILKNV